MCGGYASRLGWEVGVAQHPSAVKALSGLGMEMRARECEGEEMGTLVVCHNRNIIS